MDYVGSGSKYGGSRVENTQIARKNFIKSRIVHFNLAIQGFFVELSALRHVNELIDKNRRRWEIEPLQNKIYLISQQNHD